MQGIYEKVNNESCVKTCAGFWGVDLHEFIENEDENVSKNDCETKAFKRLSENLKRESPRLSLCVRADRLYTSEQVSERCIKDNNWHILIRYKDGSIPSIVEEYSSLAKIGAEGLDKEIAQEYPRKRRVREKHNKAELKTTGKSTNEFARVGGSRWRIENMVYEIPLSK